MISAPKLAVLGSINMDLVIRCGQLPQPGETILADAATEFCGGKGANQAVAAARLGARVSMIGCVGSDGFANRLLHGLDEQQIDRAHVHQRADCGSGFAIIAVEDSGENSIIVVPGANAALSVDDAIAATDVIRNSDALLLQLEVPDETVIAAIDIAKSAGTQVVLDPAPAAAGLPARLMQADVVCPNQSEASLILGRSIESIADARQAVEELVARGAGNAVITLGDQGAVVADGEAVEWIEAIPVKTVDTTGAGDAFTAALAVHWSQHANLFAAAQFASVAGAIAATRHGAQPGMPNLTEVDQLLATAENR